MNVKKKSNSSLDYIKKAYEFVRDEIPHSWDIGTEVVSRKASDVLLNKTGICWTKSCLLVALLRANCIPAGISVWVSGRNGRGFAKQSACRHMLTREKDSMSPLIEKDRKELLKILE